MSLFTSKLCDQCKYYFPTRTLVSLVVNMKTKLSLYRVILTINFNCERNQPGCHIKLLFHLLTDADRTSWLLSGHHTLTPYDHYWQNRWFGMNWIMITCVYDSCTVFLPMICDLFIYWLNKVVQFCKEQRLCDDGLLQCNNYFVLSERYYRLTLQSLKSGNNSCCVCTYFLINLDKAKFNFSEDVMES